MFLGARRRFLAANRIRFHHRVDDVRVLWEDRETDAAFRRVGEPAALDLRPRAASVGRLPETRTGSAGDEEVRTADALIRRSPDHVRVLRVDRDVDEARLVIDELDELPRRAAILGLVDPALWIRFPRRA